MRIASSLTYRSGRGQESPTIETAEADFNTLGVQMRGYRDFGVALQDPRGGLKVKGEA